MRDALEAIAVDLAVAIWTGDMHGGVAVVGPGRWRAWVASGANPGEYYERRVLARAEGPDAEGALMALARDLVGKAAERAALLQVRVSLAREQLGPLLQEHSRRQAAGGTP